MQDKEQEWKQRFDQLEMQVSKAARNELVLPKNEKDIEAWAKKYPDVAGIVEAIADKKASERSKDLDKRLKEIEDMRTNVKLRKQKLNCLAFTLTSRRSALMTHSMSGLAVNLSGYKMPCMRTLMMPSLLHV